MQPRRSFALMTAMLLVLGGLVFGGATSLLAQEATPGAETDQGRPAHVHTGSCDSLGDVVAPLTNLTAPVGTQAGQSDVSEVEYSFTTVPMSLDDMLASEHAINVHESTDRIDVYIACGNLGGTIDANGSLVIGLRELNDSGYAGIAVLTPNASDPATTDISAFIAEGLSGGGASGTGDLEEATPESGS